eukprot:TRINITY_DN111531_c0_g1_i1.p1 TRINITY_DN111531_c0_g1~~TRINITY_DN111531_c0_g1_i1.p1  ORF type:complete len:747 (+),score=199.34 TRINITY_DN111531_c0_g1_i1:50-2290(+)
MTAAMVKAPVTVPPPPAAAQGPPAELAQKRRQRRGGGGRGGSKGSSKAAEAADLHQRMVLEFKTTPCPQEAAMTSHDHRCCPYYHSERDRRRPIDAPDSSRPCSYRAEPCPNQFDDTRKCAFGDTCSFSHSTAELLYHPEFYRKRLCHQAKRCPRSKFCAFAHNRDELLVPYFAEGEEKRPSEDFIAHKFKTQWCPIGGTHDWENCVYAHTYRDWRRIPSLGYSSRPCPAWVSSVSSGTAELAYTARCPRGIGCPLAHGAKEQLYHPQFYKTSPCSEGNCKRGTLCAFTHGPHDLREPKPEDQVEIQCPQERESVIQAEQLLFSNQPTFWNPPRYHALEDPPKPSGKGGGRAEGGKGGQAGQKPLKAGKKGQGKGDAAAVQPMQPMQQQPVQPMQQPVAKAQPVELQLAIESQPAKTGDASERTPPPTVPGLLPPGRFPVGADGRFDGSLLSTAGPGAAAAAAAAAAVMPPQLPLPPIGPIGPIGHPQLNPMTMSPYFQWMMIEPQSRLMGPMGYDAAAAAAAAAAVGMTQPAGSGESLPPAPNPWAQLNAAFPAPMLPNAFMNPNAQSAAEEHLRKALGEITPTTAAEDGSSTKGSEPREPRPLPVKKLSRQQDYLLRKGMRTPSSLGSPPLSSAPTQSPTPTLAQTPQSQTPRESSSMSGGGSVHGASEDAHFHREVAYNHWLQPPPIAAVVTTVDAATETNVADTQAFGQMDIISKTAEAAGRLRPQDVPKLASPMKLALPAR